MANSALEDRKKIVSARFNKEIIKDLNKIANFNNSTRTEVMERYIKDGLEKSKKILKSKYVSFAIMVLTLTSIGLYIYYLLNILV